MSTSDEVSEPQIVQIVGSEVQEEGASSEVVDAESDERPPRRRWLTLTYPGMVGALLFFALALTPSLLPRPWLYEGLVAGVGAVIGYGLGVLVWWVIRRITKHAADPAAPQVVWWGLWIVGVIVMITALILGFHWQNQVRDLVGEPALEQQNFLYILLVSLFLFVLFLLISRGIRWVTRFVSRQLGRIVPSAVAQTIAVAAVFLVVYWLVTGVAFDSLVRFADNTYSAQNEGTPPGITQPTSELRSGGPGSDVTWDSIGYQGRGFVGGGPTAAEISDVTGQAAVEPIRVYAGLESADTAAERADVVVKELQRTGAFDRRVLIVAAATGTGWLEPAAVDSVEYLWGGDTAIASIQYSFLPSWISFLVDKERAAEAGQALFDAVYDEWSQLPAKHRPQLIAYGLSLGSFAGQSAFASAGDMAARTDGALWLGSPSFSEPHGQIESDRDAGSPQWQPIYGDGVTVRFAPSGTDFTSPSGAWTYPRVAYVQHANDPVVWWSPALLFEKPDWLAETPGPDRTPDMHWIPVVTFLQVTVDQFFGTSVPDLQGHNYGGQMVSAWQSVVPAPGWTSTQLDDLQKLIDSQPDD